MGPDRKPVIRPGVPEEAEDRLDEIARILALGIVRLRAKQQEQADSGENEESEFGLDFSGQQSVHADG